MTQNYHIVVSYHHEMRFERHVENDLKWIKIEAYGLERYAFASG